MIGVFDSGVGGLTVLKEIHKELPGYDTIYFGDSARYPYGNLSDAVLKQYATEDAQFLVSKGAKVIVVACNSASVAAGDLLRTNLSVPVFDVSRAPIEKALQVTKNKKIAVIGTRATIASHRHEQLLTEEDSSVKVFAVATPLLVPLVEERAWRYPEAMRILRRYLRPLKDAQVDTLILGCTHYPLIEKQIQRIMGKRVHIVSSGRATAEALRTYLENNQERAVAVSQKGQEYYFVSGDVQQFKQTAAEWLGKKITATSAAALNV
ncbi:MAG: glutamate racemase [Patescibacteria group bacterium]|jgi:glutamate racemase